MTLCPVMRQLLAAMILIRPVQPPKRPRPKPPPRLIWQRAAGLLNWPNWKKVKQKRQSAEQKKPVKIQNMLPAINRPPKSAPVRTPFGQPRRHQHHLMWPRAGAAKPMKWHRADPHRVAKEPAVVSRVR